MNGLPYIEIQADDPERAIHFYSRLFGWTFEAAPEVPIPYWRLDTGTIRGGLLQRPAKSPGDECGTNAFVCSFQVDDINAMTDTILELGGRIALPKFAVPGVCWHAYFVDMEGNTFGIYQPDENAGPATDHD
ncbi:MAG: VOC family protein [Puniceicoccaceae bacterium]|nr:MAG: VOC family protein [Puniceicoccaceae bacterium]